MLLVIRLLSLGASATPERYLRIAADQGLIHINLATTRLRKIPRTDGTNYKDIGTASRRLAACFLMALEIGPTVITESRLTLSI
jgi:hypothetical protein